jgi:hypothetical protein
MVLLDATNHFEHEKLIKCHFKPGSIERTTDRFKRGYARASSSSSRSYLKCRQPIKIGKHSIGGQHVQLTLPIKKLRNFIVVYSRYPILAVLKTL